MNFFAIRTTPWLAVISSRSKPFIICSQPRLFHTGNSSRGKSMRLTEAKAGTTPAKRAINALSKWGEFDDAEIEDFRWEEDWNMVNCGYDRRKLIRGDNWCAPVEERPLERFPEHCSKSEW